MSTSENQIGTTNRQRIPPVARIMAIIALLAVVFAIIWALQGGLKSSNDIPQIGTQAPDFTLKDSTGQSVTLSSFRGKTVLLNFWATWCVPCRSEMPAINTMARQNPNIVVLAVDVMEGQVPVSEYVKQLGLDFRPLLDTSGTVTTRYHVISMPSSFFIGADGTIRAINVGPMDQRTIEMNVKRAS